MAARKPAERVAELGSAQTTTVDLVALELPLAVAERLDAEPWVRPEAVARARAHLEEGEPTAEQLARSVVDCLVAERVR
jgi:hypothetical protein